MIATRLLRSAAGSIALLGLATACSSTNGEPVGATAGELAAAPTWIDGNVQSFKAYPAVSGLVYALGTNGNLWREQGTMATRTLVDGNVLDFQPIDGTVVYVLGTNGNLWREVGSMASRTLVAGGVSGFQVATDGSGLVYYLDTSAARRLWLIDGSAAPALLASNVLGYQYTNDANSTLPEGTCGAALYVLQTGGTLLRGDGVFDAGHTFAIETSVASFRALSGLTYYAETTNSELWHVAGPVQNEAAALGLVDTNVESFVPLNDQTSFVEDDSFNLWREQFTKSARSLVDTSVKAYEPIGPGQDTIYVLHMDGNLYLESLAAPVCSYSYAPTQCLIGDQNNSFVAAWGVATVSGTCPSIPAANGTWTEVPKGSPVPSLGAPTWASVVPTCQMLGFSNNDCCIYYWSSSSTTALSDPSVLCTPNNPAMVAFDLCGKTDPVGGPACLLPGGGGCPVCSETR